MGRGILCPFALYKSYKAFILALLDAGYYNGKNADALYDAKVSFVTRTHSNNKVFTDAVKIHRA